MGERFRPFGFPLNGPRAFSHIGIHAHEFGHRLGMLDVSGWGERFGLMDSGGALNGPDRNSACPSALEPFLRINKMRWVTPVDTLEDNQIDFTVDYDYLSPQYYILKPLFTMTNEYFLIETRGRTGFDQYTPYFGNFNHQDGASH